jgi:hypothetical protein
MRLFLADSSPQRSINHLAMRRQPGAPRKLAGPMIWRCY